ncbi:MAG TPA: DegT/DnrJ/EryC1/StrS family aminotransferase, partial [Gaiellaceae bacterium]|nr:DegT/DnrJ/EryC1/StrS family aminotransferase [Gaiellaceae bacterium]
KPGDEVITTAHSWISTSAMITHAGATVVFCDTDGATFTIDPAAVEAAITDRTRAVVAVDIYGYPCELDELRAICDARGIALIQDACEALGARYKGEAVGSQGPSAVFAFYPNKQITTGEGGMVTTHSESEWRLLKSLRNQGRADSGGWLEHARLGFNYRIDDIRAAIGLGQLEKLGAILAARTEVASRYATLLESIPGLELPCENDADHERSWFVYVVTLPVGVDREAVIASLTDRGVQTARYLPCIHLQPYMQERFGYRVGLCPVAEDLASRTLALPFHAQLGEDDQTYVADALSAALVT